MKLMHRIWLVTGIALVVAMVSLATMSYRYADIRVEANVLKTAQTLRDLLMTVRYTYHQRFLASGLPLDEHTLGFLPAHAMASISDNFQRFHNLGIRFRNVSDMARNPANQADATELEALRWFRDHPRARERMVKVEPAGRPGFYFYAAPIRIEAYCLACHGDVNKAPAAIRERYDAGFGYKVGELRGVLGIRLPSAAAEAQIQAALFREQMAHLGGVLLALLVGGLLMQKLVVRRLRDFKDGAVRLARGEYDARLRVEGPDETAELAQAFNQMAAAIQQRDESLRQNHGRLDLFREVLDHSQDAVMILEAESGRFLGFNQQACRFLGHARDELSRLSVPDLPLLGLDSKAWRAFVQEIHSQREKLVTLDLPRQDGPPLPLEISLKYHEAEGRAYILAVARDHSERRRSEAALRSSEARANSILAVAPVGIGMVVDRVIMEVNDTLLRMMGYQREELIGRSGRILYSSDEDYERVGREKYDQIREQGIGVIETRWRRKDGTRLDIILSSAPIDRADLGKGVTFTAQDITERRRAEEALQESEAKFHTMVDWTYDWEYWVNPDGSFHYITPSAERVTGYRAEEFERDPALIDAIIHAEDRHLWERHVHHHLPEGAHDGIAELDMRIVRKQGDICWVTHACRPVFDQRGHYQGRRVTVRDISARKQAENQIRHLAYFDPLTGLPNRRLLMDRLGQALIASNRSREYGAVLILDLDHFKILNDTKGHDVGDRLLVDVARRLKACVRQEDTVSRLGGDEYVVMLEGLGEQEDSAAHQAEIVAEKIHRALNEPYALEGLEREYHSTPSIGLTLFLGQDTAIEVLLKQADVALYQAKDAGRNTVRFFNPAMQAAIDSRTAMENALRRGLRHGEFKLYYQPQTDQNGRVIGAEALLRWLPPDHEVVSPAEFIPLAEETGLILPIGQWVVDTACAQLKAWESKPGTRGLRLAINVSARQFHQPDFVARVRSSLERYGVDPGLLKLELTESVVLSNIEEVIHRMGQLKALGVGFSLDDFGTGYSSLSYLKRLPLDQLKIDQSFVRDITQDPNDAAIVRAILAMSQSLGLHVIAEGVETPEQRDFLREYGCTAYQGYLFGKPMPIGEWDALL